MSANLDLVRSIYADWKRGDWSRSDWADPEIEFVFADGPEPASGRGIDALAAVTREVLSSWEDARVVPDEFRELGDGSILVQAHRTGLGKRSGVEVDAMTRTEGAWLFRIHGDLVSRLVVYWDRDRAFADLGLTPEGEDP